MIADSTGTSKIIAWESNVGILQLGMSYKLSGMNVRTYNNKKYLSIARDGFKILEIDDIGEVEEIYETERKITQAVIVGVKHFDVYIACYACNSKVIATSDVLGDCTRCATTQRIDKCKEQHSAKLDLEWKGEVNTLSAFSPILEDICGESVTKVALLMSELFDVLCSENNVIMSVTRE